jgi:hypothetical protein
VPAGGLELASSSFGLLQSLKGAVLQVATDRLQITEHVEHVAPAGDRGQGLRLAGMGAAIGLAASLLAQATLGGGGGHWLARQHTARMETASREATMALHEASLLLMQARVDLVASAEIKRIWEAARG